MYRKISNSWLKHWDFILFDLIVLQIAYVFSCVVWNGFTNPYENQVYRNIAIVICLLDICTAFFLEGYRGIMRRGYFQELKAVLKHMTAVAASEGIYLFLSKSADRFSRVSFLVFVVAAVLFIYTERILWKSYLLKHKKVFYSKRALLVLTTSDIAERILSTVQENTYNELEIVGAVIMDRDDLVGQNISGVPIVCKRQEIFDYMQTRWIDGVLVNMKKSDLLPEHFTATCVKMGITVHKKIAEIKEGISNQQLDSLGGYVVLSTNIRMATSRQLFLKRAMDICGAV
ncbi:MAG TPA: sugar transferase, partial [Candidatus Blautia ornithocaccae]|nr:sugar transferase [Candidatus Blautia ornithocaccae]